MADNHFEWLDYFIFGFLLLLSAAIGFYFAFIAKKKQNTRLEYLLGSKTMGVFPISMSLIASYVTGSFLIELPSEIYVYGTQNWVMIISEYLVCATIAYVYLPVFYKIQIISSYEYLRLRFNEKVHILGSVLFIMKMLLYLPMVVYVPVFAFRQVNGINSHFTTALACLICIFYTSVGGLKAVVWTNTIQMCSMVTGILAVLIIGIKEVGISNVIKRNKDTDRFEFDNLDTTKRDTVWGVIIGNYFYLLANCTVNQSLVQRYLAMPNRKKGNLSVLNFAIGITFIVSTCCITGLMVFAYFDGCDPWSLQKIRRLDEILPYFVMEIASVAPGLPVLFVSGVFSATLSCMSSALNSLAGVIFEDLIRTSVGSFSEKKTCFIMKIIVLIVGIFCVAMVFIVDDLNSLIQAARLSDITTGPLLGMFTLGMLFPWANATGAFFGGLSGIVVSSLMSILSQVASVHDRIQYPQKPLSTLRCPPPTLSDIDYFFSPKEVPYDFNYMKEPHWLLEISNISYVWHTLIGTVTVLFFGISASYLSGFTDPKLVNKDLITPILHRFLPEPEGKHKIPQEVEEEV